MRAYLLKRFLIFIPTLGFLGLLSFLILRLAPGNPVDKILNAGEFESPGIAGSWKEQRSYWVHRLGLDLPVFYFSVGSLEDISSGDKEQRTDSWKNYVPALLFHSDNQFHRWLFGDQVNSDGAIRGDFGISYSTGQSVSSLISDRITWSLFFTLGSVLLAYLISLPLGIHMTLYPESARTKTFSVLLVILFTLPVFWTATLLLMLFANPDVIALFPPSGVMPLGGYPVGSSLVEKVQMSLPYLIIPTVCYTYSSLAFLSRIFKVTISDVMKQDFIRTARAKGLSEYSIIRKHAFRNTLIPVITVFSTVFPASMGGSVILESIFGIPGMGLTVYQSILALDYPVLIAVFLLTGIITMIGFLITDILYVLADPRIDISGKTLS